MGTHTEVIARGLVVRRGRVLLCRNREKKYCYLPGGHVEFGEAAQDAVARELMEEAGVEVSVGDLVAVSEATFKQRGKLHHEVNLVFHVKLAGTAPIESLESEIEFVWLARASVRRADIRPASAKRLILATTRRVRFDSDVESD